MKIRNFPSGLLMTNSYLVSDDDTREAFIVDAGGYSKELSDTAGREGLKIKYLILTHGHGDHIGGVIQYQQEFPDMKLVASEAEKEILSTAAVNYSSETTGKPTSLNADLYVNDGDELEAGNMKLKIITTPGHTPGGICILTGDALFSGDTLFRTSIGRTDLHGGSFEDLSKSIKDKLFALPSDTRVFPGHMEPTTIGYEKQHNPFI